MKASELTKDDLRIPQRIDIKDIPLLDSYVSKTRYCSLKLDGNWTAVHIDMFGSVSVWTRKNRNITEQVRNNRWYGVFQNYWTGPKWIFGELWMKDVPCSSISTRLAERDELWFRAFRVEGMPDMALTAKYCKERNIGFVPFIRNGTYYEGERVFSPGVCRSFYESALPKFKPADGLVFGNEVPLYKWKPHKTIDLIYAGFKRGNKGGKYQFTCGKIILKTTEGHVVAAASGMSDAERKYIQDNNKALLGKVVEVKYNGVGVKGRLRHPNFVMFRPDKHKDECSMYQDEELAWTIKHL